MTLSKEKFEHILAYAKQQQKLGVHHCNILPDDMVEIMEMAAGKMERRERDGQEPVAWRWRQNETKPWHLTVHSDCAGEVQPLYVAPPAPISLVNRLDTLLNGEEATGNKTDDDIYKDVSSLLEHALYLAERTKAYRAAMLKQPSSIQGSDDAASGAEINQPASNGQLFGNSEQLEPVSQPCKLRDGLAEIRKLGPIDAEKIQAERDALNSPAIPDGWVMVPAEPTEAMMLHKSGCQHHAWNDPDCAMRQTRRLVWANMLAAAPKQESL